MLKKQPRRAFAAINAGSMADIAFLLLIFFLVTTTISVDAGIAVRLPPWSVQPPAHVPDRNTLLVKINARNELFVENEVAQPAQLRHMAKDYIMNPGGLPSRPSKPTKAVVSLIHDRGTSYVTYLAVYNEIMGAYNELWEARAQQQYGIPYTQLNMEHQREIRKVIPLVISEAEPVEYGEVR